MGALDPQSAFDRLAAITARCDSKQFTSSTTPTSFLSTPHPLQAAFRPSTTDVVMVSWQGTYRGSTYGGEFVCDASIQKLAMAALVDHASQVLDAVDVRRKAQGFDPAGGP